MTGPSTYNMTGPSTYNMVKCEKSFLWKIITIVIDCNDFLCANILKDQAQWRDKTKGLSKLVMV